MSSLLEQAIIDAKTLKETARKNAEAAILEKYSAEIKNSIETLLEQDEPVAAGAEASAAETTPEIDLDLGAAAGPSPETKKMVDSIPPAYLGENNMEEIELDLDSLVEKVDMMKKELNVQSVETPETYSKPVEQTPQRIAQDTIAEGESSMPEAGEEEEESLEESFELDEKIQEELTVDMEVVVPGGLQGNKIETDKQMAVAKALEAQLEDLKEHLSIKDAEIESLQEELATANLTLEESKSMVVETKAKLKKSMAINLQLKESFELFSNKINEVNVINARLLYTNKVLRNASLNERQRNQIAEAISNASTVEEAKTVYETLQRSMESLVEKRSAPQSLTEAVSKTASPFLPRTTNTVDPTQDRWKILAGIKK